MGGPGSGSKPRDYPAEVVDLICGMYGDGMTVAQIRAAAPRGYKVQTILERYLPARRPAMPQDQSGDRNPQWKGGECGYQAAHLRVASSLGRAADHPCVDCESRAADWTYVHGCPDERVDRRLRYCPHLEHYAPRCRRCHRRYDRKDRHA